MHQVTKHGATMVAAFFLMAVLNYAFGVALSWVFPPAEYGVLGVAQSLLLLTALVAGSGFAWTANHDISGSELTPNVRRRFRMAWVANIALCGVVALAIWAVYALGWLPFGPAYREVIPFVGLTTVILAARAVLNGAMRGFNLFGQLAFNQVGEVVIKAVAGLGLVWLGFGAGGVLMGFSIGAFLALAHCLWVLRDRGLWSGSGWFDRDVLIHTAPLFVGMFGPALMLNLDVLGLKLLAPASIGDQLAGYYQAAIILARTPVFVAQSLTMVLFSFVAGGKKLQSGEEGYLAAALRAWSRLLLPVGLLLLLAPREVLALFFPAAYQEAALALQGASVGCLLLALVTLVNGVAQAAGERRRSTAAAICGVLVQLLTLAWAVPIWGAAGAALSLIAAGSTALLILSPLLLRLAGEWRSTAALRAVVVEATPQIAFTLALLLIPGGDRLMTLLKLLVSGAVYLGTLVAVHLASETRETGASRESAAYNPLYRFVHVLMGG